MKKKLKALNLYSGIGGNRKLWQNVSVTAVEWDADIANIYKRLYPKDKIIVGDAHEYLEKNYKEFDFIWSSPPCQTHSSFRYNIGVRYRGVAATYADMKLYQEILFLKHYAFSGIGGFALAAKSTWKERYRCVGFCEIDKFCQKVLRKNFGNGIPIFDDIKKLTGEEFGKPIKLVTGGFPCQPFSVAGIRRGKDDNRYLWDEMWHY